MMSVVIVNEKAGSSAMDSIKSSWSVRAEVAFLVGLVLSNVGQCSQPPSHVPTSCLCQVSSHILHPVLLPLLCHCLKESVLGFSPFSTSLFHVSFPKQGINSWCHAGCSQIPPSKKCHGEHSPVTRRSCHGEMGHLKSHCHS